VIAASQKHQEELEEGRARKHLEQLEQQHREQNRARKHRGQERPAREVNWGEFIGDIMSVYPGQLSGESWLISY
jgi:hypothetical protein